MKTLHTLAVDKLTTAIQAGTDFLKRQLVAGKCGLSCFDSAGNLFFSDEKGHLFSNFFLTKAIGEDLSESERALVLMRIHSEELNGAWGYSAGKYFKGPTNYPYIDADDTIMALRTIRKLNNFKPLDCLPIFYRKSLRFTNKGIHLEKGFITFPTVRKGTAIYDPFSNKEIRDKREKGFSRFGTRSNYHLVTEPSPGNNFEMHPEVNANFFLMLLGTDYEEYINPKLIRRCQAPEGYWYSYFYPGKYFGSNSFMELLAQLPGFENEIEKTIRFLHQQQMADGSWGDPYNSGLALQALGRHTPVDEHLARGIDYILKNQDSDGAWKSTETIWHFYEAADDVLIAKDVHNVVTTASCISALKIILENCKR